MVKGKGDDHYKDDLLDTVLVATVDGKFHALRRSTGVLVWSMADDDSGFLKESSTSPQNVLAPLVKTETPPLDEVNEGDDDLYVVEPQSGAIYILPPSSSPDTPLTKLQYTVPKLVEMSPFVFPGDEGR